MTPLPLAPALSPVPAPGTATAPARVAKFLVPDIIFGVGVLSEVGQAVRRQGGVHVFVVSDPGVVEVGWTSEALGYLAAAGGSCIDAAKAIAMLATHGGRITDYAGVGKVSGPLPPTVMVPTTGGSGSDVSQFCVVTDTTRRLKVTIGARALVPDISVTDPRALTTVPPDITAYTALDVLSHAIESYVSKAATFLTDVQALAAIRGVTRYLFPALDRLDDLRAREGLARASLHAGLAFTNALLGATHAISHQIGGLTDLPHGLLNAIVLPHVMEFNAPVCAERLADVAAAMGLATGAMKPHEAADAAIETVRAFVAKAGLPAGLGEIGVPMLHFDEIARNALDDAYIVTNPRDVREEDARAICLAAW